MQNTSTTVSKPKTLKKERQFQKLDKKRLGRALEEVFKTVNPASLTIFIFYLGLATLIICGLVYSIIFFMNMLTVQAIWVGLGIFTFFWFYKAFAIFKKAYEDS